MFLDPRTQIVAERIFSSVKPAHQQQVRVRFRGQYRIECLNQLRQPFVAGQAPHKTHYRRIRRKTEPSSQYARTGVKTLYIDSVAAAAAQQAQFALEPAQKIDPRRHTAEHAGDCAQQSGFGRAEFRHLRLEPIEKPPQAHQRHKIRNRRYLPSHRNFNRFNPFQSGRAGKQLARA